MNHAKDNFLSATTTKQRYDMLLFNARSYGFIELLSEPERTALLHYALGPYGNRDIYQRILQNLPKKEKEKESARASKAEINAFTRKLQEDQAAHAEAARQAQIAEAEAAHQAQAAQAAQAAEINRQIKENIERTEANKTPSQRQKNNENTRRNLNNFILSPRNNTKSVNEHIARGKQISRLSITRHTPSPSEKNKLIRLLNSEVSIINEDLKKINSKIRRKIILEAMVRNTKKYSPEEKQRGANKIHLDLKNLQDTSASLNKERDKRINKIRELQSVTSSSPSEETLEATAGLSPKEMEERKKLDKTIANGIARGNILTQKLAKGGKRTQRKTRRR